MFLEGRAPVAGALLSGLLAGVVLAQSPAGPPSGAAVQSRQGSAAGVRVSGRLVPPERLHLTGGSLVLAPLGDTPRPELSGVTLLPDGSFAFDHVPPGRYEIRARGQLDPGNAAHFATFHLHVEDAALDDVVMPLRPAATLSGSVAFNRSGLPSSGLRVRASLPADAASSGDVTTADVRPDGAFVLSGLMTGTHLLQVDGLPERWVLKSVVFRGEDVTDAGIETTPGQRLANVRVTVTDAATEVSGVVTDADGHPVTDAVVLIIPLSEQFWRRSSRRLAVLHTDGEGRFLIRGLPEGEYRAAACRPSGEDDPSRPEVLRRFSESGVAVSLRGIGHRVVNLTLTPPAAGASVR